jgi:hypothetical protein
MIVLARLGELQRCICKRLIVGVTVSLPALRVRTDIKPVNKLSHLGISRPPILICLDQMSRHRGIVLSARGCRGLHPSDVSCQRKRAVRRGYIFGRILRGDDAMNATSDEGKGQKGHRTSSRQSRVPGANIPVGEQRSVHLHGISMAPRWQSYRWVPLVILTRPQPQFLTTLVNIQ